MTANTDNEVIGKRIRNFRIVSKIGEGGMGVVYLAEHIVLPKRFAIKSLSRALSRDPGFQKRFEREPQIQALLDHPNIVQVTDFFDEDGQYFLVMEYVDGEDLAKLITERGKVPEDEALAIFKAILTGLEFAHSRGVIHRDVKPSNVLVDKTGRARIVDFGIAILAGAGEGRLTSTGAAVGSPWYMSPEQILHPQELDHRTDIYSLGIVLYEMLTGKAPFDGDTDFTVKEHQVNSPVPDPRQKNSEIPEELAQVVIKAMAKNPAERFQNCTEFLQCIQEYEINKGPTPPRPWNLRYPVLWGIAGILVLSLGIRIMTDLRSIPDDASVQRQIAYNLIQTASEKALMICRELERIDLKRKGVEIAKKIDSSTADALRRQIQDLDKNISDAMPAYGNLIIQLVSLQNGIVDGEFEHYARSLRDKSLFEQIPMTRMMKDHFEDHRGGKKKLNVNMIRNDCERARGKGT